MISVNFWSDRVYKAESFRKRTARSTLSNIWEAA